MQSAPEAKHQFYQSWPQVRVVGIQSWAQLNDRVVRVGKLIEATGRFRVLVPASEVAMGL